MTYTKRWNCTYFLQLSDLDNLLKLKCGGGVGGYSATSDLALGKKVGNLDFLGFGGGGILKLKSHKVARSKVQFSWGGVF